MIVLRLVETSFVSIFYLHSLLDKVMSHNQLVADPGFSWGEGGANSQFGCASLFFWPKTA